MLSKPVSYLDSDTMEVTIFKTVFAVVAVVVLTGSARAGYIYPRPNIAFELPKSVPHFQEQLRQKTLKENALHKTQESVVSYSVPFENFNYLHQIKTGNLHSTNLDLRTQVEPAVNGPAVTIPAANNFLPSAQLINTIAGNIANNNIAVEEHTAARVNSRIPDINIPAINFPAPIEQSNDVLVNSDFEHTNIPNVNIKTVNVPPSISQQSDFVVNTLPQINIPTSNIPTLTFNSAIQHPSNLEINTVHHEISIPALSTPNLDLPIPLQHQNNLQFSEQHIISQDVNTELIAPVNVQNSVPQKITKHIYFHAPPPEIDEPVVHTVTPRKKIYKIIFIKVPSQAPKSTALLQGNANFVAPIEEKTIIYVLSKKPEEPQQYFLPKPTPSEHEVLFVKYSGNPNVAAAQARDTLQPETELLEQSSGLQPGLINGNP